VKSLHACAKCQRHGTQNQAALPLWPWGTFPTCQGKQRHVGNVPHAMRRQQGSQPENQAVSEHLKQLKYPSFGAVGEGRFREIKKIVRNNYLLIVYGQKSNVRSVNRVHNGPCRQRKVNEFRGLTMAEHCAFAFAALYNALHNGPLARLNPDTVRPKNASVIYFLPPSNSHFSEKKPASTMPAGVRGVAGWVTSKIAQSGNLGTWRALLR